MQGRIAWVTPVLLVVGHFAPWAQHKTAALTQSAHDLAISTHDTPGAGIFLNQFFYLPVWVAAVLLIQVVPARGVIARAAVMVLAMFVACFGLPEYPKYFDKNFLPQFIVTGVVCGLILILGVWPTLVQGRRWQTWLALGLPVVAAVPLAGYLAILGPLQALYRDSVWIGSGWWVTLVVVTGSLIVASINARRSFTAP